MPRRRPASDDFDSPWKDALHVYFPSFLALFFPDIQASIDWSRGFEALDKEFQQIIRQAKQGKRLADKLFKVWALGGDECWLFIHVEVQGKSEADFPERMFNYNIAVRRLYNQTVVSLAVLCDERGDWRPDTFSYGRWGSQVELRFRMAKLLDFRRNIGDLTASDNPVACVVLAHLQALETQKDPANRTQLKLQIVKGLYRRNWSKEDIVRLFRLVDWIMSLPVELQEAFREEMHQFEEERKMPYLSSIERLAIDKGMKEGLEQGMQIGLNEGRQNGLQKGLLEAIFLDLNDRFSKPSRKLLEQIQAIKEVSKLRALLRFIKKAKTLDEVRDYLNEAASR